MNRLGTDKEDRQSKGGRGEGGGGFSFSESSRGTSSFLNLLFQYEDTLPLLRGKHGDLFWSQLEYLHN